MVEVEIEVALASAAVIVVGVHYYYYYYSTVVPFALLTSGHFFSVVVAAVLYLYHY